MQNTLLVLRFFLFIYFYFLPSKRFVIDIILGQNKTNTFTFFRCSCENGVCDRINGTCACAKGWYGDNCNIPCPQGYYGQGCIYKCGFKPTEIRKKCNPVNGHMICVAGYRGNNCEHPCDPFWYGEDCTSKCTCKQENTNMCDPQKGQCICKPGFRGEK